MEKIKQLNEEFQTMFDEFCKMERETNVLNQKRLKNREEAWHLQYPGFAEGVLVTFTSKHGTVTKAVFSGIRYNLEKFTYEVRVRKINKYGNLFNSYYLLTGIEYKTLNSLKEHYAKPQK